jgi:hypothetical protein
MLPPASTPLEGGFNTPLHTQRARSPMSARRMKTQKALHRRCKKPVIVLQAGDYVGVWLPMGQMRSEQRYVKGRICEIEESSQGYTMHVDDNTNSAHFIYDDAMVSVDVYDDEFQEIGRIPCLTAVNLKESMIHGGEQRMKRKMNRAYIRRNNASRALLRSQAQSAELAALVDSDDPEPTDDTTSATSSGDERFRESRYPHTE